MYICSTVYAVFRYLYEVTDICIHSEGPLHCAHFPTHSCRSLTFCTFPNPLLQVSYILHISPTHSCRSLTFCTFPNPLLQVSYILHISQPTPAGLLHSAHFPTHSCRSLIFCTFSDPFCGPLALFHLSQPAPASLWHSACSNLPLQIFALCVLPTHSCPLSQVTCTLHNFQPTTAGLLYSAICCVHSSRSLTLSAFSIHSCRFLVLCNFLNLLLQVSSTLHIPISLL